MPTLKPRRRPQSGAGGSSSSSSSNNTVRAGPDGSRGQSNRNRPRLQSYTNVDRATDDEGGAASAAAATSTKRRKASGGGNNKSGSGSRSNLAEESLAPPAKARKSSSSGQNGDVAKCGGATKSNRNGTGAAAANAASMHGSAPTSTVAGATSTCKSTPSGGDVSIGVKGEIQLHELDASGSSPSWKRGHKFIGELLLRSACARVGGATDTIVSISSTGSDAASADSSLDLDQYCDKKVTQAHVVEKKSGSAKKFIRPHKIRLRLDGGKLALAVKPWKAADLATSIEFLLDHDMFRSDDEVAAKNAIAHVQWLEGEMATKSSAFEVEGGMEGGDEEETQGIGGDFDNTAGTAGSRGMAEGQRVADDVGRAAEEAEAREAARLAEEARLEQERIAAEKAAAEEAADNPPPTDVEVQFKCDKTGQSIISIIVGLDEKFSTVVQEHANQVELDANSLRFLCDGVRIENTTPAGLEFHLKTKEDCVVDVVVEQTGG